MSKARRIARAERARSIGVLAGTALIFVTAPVPVLLFVDRNRR